jgi:NAD(P)-dependent dehydrogenase (short-subunit alcohol dehydrogenase family)
MERIEGQHGFVTGGASGLGLAIAQALHEAGARVTIADVDTERLDALDMPFVKCVLDVRDRDGWDAAKRTAEAANGPVSILCNNAGIGPNRAELADMDPAVFDRMVAIKLTGSFNGVRCFAPDMRERKAGHIVNTASMAALYTDARLGEYGAAKAGLVHMSEVLRLELAPHDVGVSLFCPGMVATSLPVTMAKAEGRYDPSMADLKMPGIPPEIAAARVIAGIRGNWPYILTHGERKASVAARCDAILAAFDETPASTDLPGV